MELKIRRYTASKLSSNLIASLGYIDPDSKTFLGRYIIILCGP
jgi:hypothetical protein